MATYNLIRERAGLAPHTLGVDVTTQEEVLAAIDHERRLELASKGTACRIWSAPAGGASARHSRLQDPIPDSADRARST